MDIGFFKWMYYDTWADDTLDRTHVLLNMKSRSRHEKLHIQMTPQIIAVVLDCISDVECKSLLLKKQYTLDPGIRRFQQTLNWKTVCWGLLFIGTESVEFCKEYQTQQHMDLGNEKRKRTLGNRETRKDKKEEGDLIKCLKNQSCY